MIKRRLFQGLLFFAAIVTSNLAFACTQLAEGTTFCFEGTYWSEPDMSDVLMSQSSDFGSVWAQSPNGTLRLILQWDRAPERDARQLFGHFITTQHPSYPGCETHSVTHECPLVEYFEVPSEYLNIPDDAVVAYRATYPGDAFVGDQFNGHTTLWSIHANAEADVYVFTKAFYSNELTPAHLEAHRRAVAAIRLGPEERPL